MERNMAAEWQGTKTEQAAGYQLLSRYRPEPMGIAMLWVMLFRAYEFHFGIPVLEAVKQLGFGGVESTIGFASPAASTGMCPPCWRFTCRRLLGCGSCAAAAIPGG
ncbi:MAG: hypothetical protein Q4C45_01685 [Oscillospiraceae bacterium]|nr:hypothetical protein [Oscillospiraceae bacterium]